MVNIKAIQSLDADSTIISQLEENAWKLVAINVRQDDKSRVDFFIYTMRKLDVYIDVDLVSKEVSGYRIVRTPQGDQRYDLFFRNDYLFDALKVNAWYSSISKQFKSLKKT